MFFDFIIEEKVENPLAKSNMFLLNIIGTDFTPYYNFLKGLGIDVYVRTDNDLKATTLEGNKRTSLLGLNRAYKLYDDTDQGWSVPEEIKSKKNEKQRAK